MRHWHGASAGVIEDFRKGGKWRGQPSSCEEAAREASAEALMYAHDVIGLPWDARTCRSAAEAGNIACLSFAHAAGCPLDRRVRKAAEKAGTVDCLAYAHKHGAIMTKHTCKRAAHYAKLDCLAYAHKHGCPWTAEVPAAAAGAGSLACVRYAHEKRCPWDEATCTRAADGKSMDCLAYAHENGCPWDAATCRWAAHSGALNCLIYAHEHGCPWDSQCLLAACIQGHLACMIYAYENNCPGNPSGLFGLTVAAVQGGNLLCLAYVHVVMGCNWSPEGKECQAAFRTGLCEMLKYVHVHGGVWRNDLRQMCPKFDRWLQSSEVHGRREKARCLLYMHCCGGSELPPVWHSAVGRETMRLMEVRRTAVLQCFHPGIAERPGKCALRRIMQIVPSDLVQQIICAAKLQAPKCNAPVT